MRSVKKTLDLLCLRHELLRGVARPVPSTCRLPTGYVLDVASEQTLCENCGTALCVQWTTTRRPFGIVLGEPVLRHHIKRCPRCHRVYRCGSMNMLVPPGGKYSYDVLVEVGLGRFVHHRRNKQITQTFAGEHGRELPAGDIHHLACAFLDSLAAVHEEHSEDIAALIQCNGGWVCHLDGTCEAGTGVLFAVIDGLTGLTLHAVRMPTENAKDIRKAVDHCVQRFGPPLAVMRDLSSNVQRAVAHLPASVKHFICQYHFLENVGKSLIGEPHAELTRHLRKTKICPRLRSLRRDLVRYSRGAAPITPTEFEQILDTSGSASRLNPIQLRRYIAYFLLRWQDDYYADLSGERFPFDQPNLVLYRRCAKLLDFLQGLLAENPGLTRVQPTLGTICKALAPVHRNPALVDSAERLQKAVDLFTELRKALRFKRRDDSPVGRDHAPEFSVRTARQNKARLAVFRDKLETLTKPENSPETREDAQKILDYLHRYRDTLQGHIIELPGAQQPILAARTNAIAEQQFGELKKNWRRRLATKRLARQLQAAPPEELLVVNLRNEQYVQALYDGNLDNLPDRFARVAVKAQARRCTQRNASDQHVIPIAKKSLRDPNIIQRVGGMLQRLAACLS